MKNRNFLSHILGLVERELEATLAILILLAGVVGYTLAGTETATQLVANQLGIQTASTFSVGSGSYQTLSLDPNLIGTGIVRIRTLSIPSGSLTNILTLKGVGITGGTSTAEYTVKIPLASTYSGQAYVWFSDGSVKLNDTAVVSATTPVTINASELVLNFTGSAKIQAISVNPKTATPTPTMASLNVLPNTATVEVGITRTFVALATDTTGAAMANPAITWSITANPANAGTIDAKTGEVTALLPGTLTVIAKTDGYSASATVTVLPKADTTANFPGVEEGTGGTSTATPTTTTPVANNTVVTKTNLDDEVWFGNNGSATPAGQSILDMIKTAVTGGPASAATSETTANASIASKTATAMFSPDVITARVIATSKPLPTKSEVAAVTKSMTFTQKVVTNVQIGLKELSFQIKSMVSGTVVTDRNGKTIYQEKSLGQRIGALVQGLTGGANAGTTGITPIGEDDNLQ